jgi:acyl-CoA thioesterase-1
MASIAATYGLGAALRKAVGLTLLFLMLAVPAANAAPVRLLVLGDSLSAGFGLPHEQGFEAQLQAALAERGHDVRIIDAAVSGDTTAGGRARLDWALAEGADAAIVELGANDGLRGIDPKAMEANLTAILDTLAARHIPVLLSGMYAPPNLGPEYGRAFRAVFDKLGHRPGILYDPFFLEGIATDPALNQADGLHPNAEGVKRNVARLTPLVEKLLAEVQNQEVQNQMKGGE